MSVICPAVFSESKRGWRDVHFSVSDHNIPIASETLDTLVFVSVPVVGVQKIAVAEQKVVNGILVFAQWFSWIMPKYVNNFTPIAYAGRNLAVAITSGDPSGKL